MGHFEKIGNMVHVN